MNIARARFPADENKWTRFYLSNERYSYYEHWRTALNTLYKNRRVRKAADKKEEYAALHQATRDLHAAFCRADWVEWRHAIARFNLALMTLKALHLHPLAIRGQRFNEGRKHGTGGPIRKEIAKLLRRNPALKNPELWAAITNSPPRGWAYITTGKRLEGRTSKDHMELGRFFNICGEERRKSKP